MVIDDSDAAPDHPLCPDASTAPAAHTPAPTSPGEATELACHPDACPALATVPLGPIEEAVVGADSSESTMPVPPHDTAVPTGGLAVTRTWTFGR
ncbi:hypothetical protein CLOP_g4309 [Closterium sp. NIES-67]|nr:hypothetical protein CLOP_g4309 [Closterium sp. NIES-67]